VVREEADSRTFYRAEEEGEATARATMAINGYGGFEAFKRALD
jgi:hypothetical protein